MVIGRSHGEINPGEVAQAGRCSNRPDELDQLVERPRRPDRGEGAKGSTTSMSA
jgi:hypothetical protein